MSVSLARVVLWCFLALLLPLPFYQWQWGVLPAGRVMYVCWAQPDARLLVQLAAWLLVLAGVAAGYGRLVRDWPPRIRGSVAGVCGLLMLLLFSTFEVYRPLAPQQARWIEFREVYRGVEP